MKEINSLELFAGARDNMRIVLGIIFALFIICFVAVVIEEMFLGGRRRRKAIKAARLRMLSDKSITTPARQSSDTPHLPQ